MPKTVTQVWKFVGFSSYYRKFIPDFSEIVQPLTRLTKKSVRFCWSPTCQKAFDTLKEKIATPPVLAYPRSEGEYILDTDVSNHAISVVLSQIQDGEDCVIAYASKALQGGQENYCTTKRELLATVSCVEYFRYYLYVTNFTIRTDHAALKWPKNFQNIDGLLARWLSKLEQYDYTIVHRKGPQHVTADGLTRLPIKKCPRTDCPHNTMKICKVTAQQPVDDTDEWLVGWDNSLDWQRKDPVLARVIGWLEKLPQLPKGIAQYNGQTKAYFTQLDTIYINEQGVLCQKWYPQGKGITELEVSQIVAPCEIRYQILESLHNSPTGAHLGRAKTINKVRFRFYWSGYKNEIVSPMRHMRT